MKFTSIILALCSACMFAVAVPAFAQTPSPQTGSASSAAASQGMPSGMMQMIPPEMMQMMQMMQKMHGGSLARMAMMGGSLMSPGGAIQNVEGHIAFLKAELKITDAQQKW
jgi:hypothetical protein